MAQSKAELNSESQLEPQSEPHNNLVPRVKYVETMNPFEPYYDISKKKGLAVIFYHTDFIESKGLNASEDVNTFTECFTKLNFDVQPYENLKVADIVSVLQHIANPKAFDWSCLIVAVSSHGNEFEISAADGNYNRSILWETFAGKLVGVPKLYFLDTCRGHKKDFGIEVEVADSATRDYAYKLPTMADFLFAFSSCEGYESYDLTDGSYYLRKLCKEIKDRYRDWDLLQILTFVNQRMSFDFQMSIDNEKDLKVMPQVVTTLTKLFKFRKTGESTQAMSTDL